MHRAGRIRQSPLGARSRPAAPSAHPLGLVQAAELAGPSLRNGKKTFAARFCVRRDAHFGQDALCSPLMLRTSWSKLPLHRLHRYIRKWARNCSFTLSESPRIHGSSRSSDTETNQSTSKSCDCRSAYYLNWRTTRPIHYNRRAGSGVAGIGRRAQDLGSCTERCRGSTPLSCIDTIPYQTAERTERQ